MPGSPVVIISWSLLRFMSTESVTLSNHLIFCLPLLFPSVFPSIKVFSKELALCIKWPKYWSFSNSVLVAQSCPTICYPVGFGLGEGNGNPFPYACLENPMDGGAWKAAVHGVAEGWTRLSDFTFTHWRRKWQPTPVFLPGESQGRGRLVGCCLWGRTESDTTEAT